MNGAQTRDRVLLEAIKAQFPNEKAYKSYLRQDVVLQNNKNNYRFDLLKKEGVTLPQRLLSQQDVFWANYIGLFLCVERITKPGSGRLITHPNLVELSAAGLTSAEDLEAVYNGTISYKVNTSEEIREMDTRRFRKVRNLIAQASALDTGAAVKLASDFSEQEYLDGLEETEPYLIISGQRTNQIDVTLPNFDVTPAWASTNGTHVVKLVLVAVGFELPSKALSFAK